MPDDYATPGSVSLAMPSKMIEAYDKLAAALERPREWVMLRALRQYLEDGEGAEIAEDSESLAELERGESVSADDLHKKLTGIIERAAQQRARDE